MSTRPWWLRRVHAAGRERGATLLLALLFVTVMALTISGVLTVAFANLRATQALQQHSVEAAMADGAAQIAINELRTSGTLCFNGTDTRDVEPIPGAGSATVECTLDGDSSEWFGVLPSFPWALVTLPAGGGHGIDIDVRGQESSVEFAGTVGAEGQVRVEDGLLRVTNGALNARGCDIDPAEIMVGGLGIDDSHPMCHGTGIPDPNLRLPSAVSPGDPGAWDYVDSDGHPQDDCDSDTRKITFHPGVYEDSWPTSSFRSRFACGGDNIVYDFRPGVYWFDFSGRGPGANVWRVRKGTLVAGSPEDLPGGEPGTFPTTACDHVGGGVIFVFGGRSRWEIDDEARVQVCGLASGSATVPPIAIYGLNTKVGDVAAQRGCVASGSCPVLSIEDRAEVYVRGVTYLPRSRIDVDLDGPNDAYAGAFAGGIVARRFDLSAGEGVRFATPFVAAPPGSGTGRTVVRLAVYVCPGQATCGTGGPAALTATVGLLGPPLADQRRVEIYSWSTAG